MKKTNQDKKKQLFIKLYCKKNNLHKRVKDNAKKEGLSDSAFLARCVDFYLNNKD